MNGWRVMRLGDFITLQRGHDLPEPHRRPGTVPVMGSFGITGYHDTAKAKGPGVIVGRSGASFGVISYSPVDYWPLNTALYVIDFHGNDERFAYYLLKTIDFTRYNSGSAQPSLNRNYIHPIPVKVPPLPIQCHIVEILGALDDKIEVNRRIDQTLGALAQALYKHWFVDFGPFRGGEFVNSQLRLIPKGWYVGKLGDVLQNMHTAADPRSLPSNTPYIGLEHMPRTSIALSNWGSAADVTSNKCWFRRKHILFGKLRPYFKKVGVAPVDGVCSSDILVLEPCRPAFFGLGLCQVIQDEFINFTDAASGGTRMPRISWEQMALYPLTIPPENIAAQFSAQVESWVDTIISNIAENQTLTRTRDYLLPKLLSGEIDVKAAEREVEKAI